LKTSENQNAIFPQGQKAPQYFSGDAFVKMLIENPLLNTTIGNVVFEPGCRNSWHSHPGGQILICINGTGYFQEKGKPIQLLQTGDVIQIAENVVHWHGATPDSEFTHIAVGPNADKGGPVWLDPVTEEEYNSYRQENA